MNHMQKKNSLALLFFAVAIIPLQDQALDLTSCGDLASPNTVYVLKNDVSDSGFQPLALLSKWG
jgi:hypothetical protein